MTGALIKPQTLKGFRDYLPEQMRAREHLIDTARQVYRGYGFSPIDTPALEYTEVLLGKGGAETDKQMFRFTDQGGRDVAMRFDLTVPFARFAAQHLPAIGTPFKRYHIGTVWRAEKPQRGRFREFMQCDFDTIGTASNTADIETLLVIHDLMENFGFSKFTIQLNNRLVLNGLLEKLDVREKTVAILRALDKLSKVGRDGVREELTARVGMTAEQTERILELVMLAGSSNDVCSQLESLLAGNEQGTLGVRRLRELFAACRTCGIPADRVALDVSIARGLDYYTGTVYETFLSELPGIGSVCSGGRYDDLAGLFTTQTLPGVGASLGVDRLLAAMEELGMIDPAVSATPVLVALFDPARVADYLRIGRLLRAAGIACELFPEARPLGKQLRYASRNGFRIALIAGESEFAEGLWQVKDLDRGEQKAVPESDLTEHIRKIL